MILAEPVIYVYHHVYGRPLERVHNGIHFAYLEPINVPMYNTIDNGIQYTHAPNIISQESDVIDLEPCPTNTSYQLNTQQESTIPATVICAKQSSQELDVTDLEPFSTKTSHQLNTQQKSTIPATVIRTKQSNLHSLNISPTKQSNKNIPSLSTLL